MVLISRKVLIMSALLFFGEIMETAWFLGSTVVIVAVLLHSYARPYEDQLIDWCEFFSLVSTLFIYMSSVVFKVFNDPSKPETNYQANALKDGLEYVSIFVTLLNVAFGVIINYRIIKVVLNNESDEDYRVSLLQKHLADVAAELEHLQQVYDEAKENALEKQKHKLLKQESLSNRNLKSPGEDPTGDKMATFENPLEDDDDDDDGRSFAVEANAQVDVEADGETFEEESHRSTT